MLPKRGSNPCNRKMSLPLGFCLMQDGMLPPVPDWPSFCLQCVRDLSYYRDGMSNAVVQSGELP